MKFKQMALKALMKKAETDRSNALASLTMMLDHPAGIGDPSTGDLYDKLNEALSALSDADDRIDTLKLYGDFDVDWE